MFKNKVCHSSMPVTVQACHRVRKLALPSNRSHDYAVHSRAALTNSGAKVLSAGETCGPRATPAPVILIRTAGLLWQ